MGNRNQTTPPASAAPLAPFAPWALLALAFATILPLGAQTLVHPDAGKAGRGTRVGPLHPPASAPAMPTEAPCRVAIRLREADRKPAESADTLIPLHAGKSASLAIEVINLGKPASLSLAWQGSGSTFGEGARPRELSLGAGETRTLRTAIRGESLARACREDARTLRVTAREGSPDGPVCGEALKHFSCDPSRESLEIRVEALVTARDTTQAGNATARPEEAKP